MSIQHKAWLFNDKAFSAELADLLYAALASGETGALAEFIDRHQGTLTDLGTGGPLPAGWVQSLRRPDVLTLADVALTRYYTLAQERGLSYGFDALAAYLRTIPELRAKAGLLICGRMFGPKGHRLDPGRMGTGLLSAPEAAQLSRLLEQTAWPPVPGPESGVYDDCHYTPRTSDEVRDSLERLRSLYRAAREVDRGVLFADFNDCGVGHL